MSSVTSPSRGPSARHRGKLVVLGAIALTTALLLSTAPSSAATAPTLGTAGSFAVLASSTVTNTGPTVVNGDLGVSPGAAITGFAEVDGGPGLVNGTVHGGDAVAQQAQSDASTAYTDLASQACPVENDLTGEDLVGLTLTAGVYCFSSSAQLSGTLTLDAEGDPDAVFVFQIGSTLTTASNSSVLVTNSEAACNVFWQVGSAATLGTGTDFVGTVLAGTEAITATTGATVMGRLVSLNAAVTLDSNVVSASSCTDAGTSDGTTDGATTGGTATGGTTDGTSTGGTATGGTTDGTTGTTDGATTDGTVAGGATDGATTDGTVTGGATDGATTGGTTTGPVDSGAGPVPPTGAGTTGGGDTGGGTDDAGTAGGSADDGGMTRSGLPATGASGAVGMSLLGGMAVAFGIALTCLSARRRAAASTPGEQPLDSDLTRSSKG